MMPHSIHLKQDNENKAGVAHSLYRHYDTKTNNYTNDELLLIQSIIINEKKKNEGKDSVYKLKKEGITYTVTTSKYGSEERFTNFYTNKKQIETNRSNNTDIQHLNNSLSVSDAKVE